MGYNESAHRSAGSKLSFSKNWDERIQLVIVVFMRFRQVRVGSTGEADLLRSNFAASMIVNPARPLFSKGRRQSQARRLRQWGCKKAPAGGKAVLNGESVEGIGVIGRPDFISDAEDAEVYSAVSAGAGFNLHLRVFGAQLAFQPEGLPLPSRLSPWSRY